MLIYIAIVREVMSFFKHAKSSSQVLNSFEKRKKKKCDFLKRIIISFKRCFGELH